MGSCFHPLPRQFCASPNPGGDRVVDRCPVGRVCLTLSAQTCTNMRSLRLSDQEGGDYSGVVFSSAVTDGG